MSTPPMLVGGGGTGLTLYSAELQARQGRPELRVQRGILARPARLVLPAQRGIQVCLARWRGVRRLLAQPVKMGQACSTPTAPARPPSTSTSVTRRCIGFGLAHSRRAHDERRPLVIATYGGYDVIVQWEPWGKWGFAAGRVFGPRPGHKFFVHVGPIFCWVWRLSAAEKASFFIE
jgi:hypothetical protein